MEAAALSLDCEDMFKEITKKLYGEEAGALGAGVEFPGSDEDGPEEHLTAWGLAALMQNGFPPPGILAANFTPRTDPAAEDRWSAADEPLGWAHSRVAAYNPAQRLFKCADCECVGFLARVAEHWLGAHSQARAFCCPLPGCGFGAAWARGLRAHLLREHRQPLEPADSLLRDNPALTDLTRYLQRLKAKVDARRVAPEPAPPDKRYACAACPYATDRRDLFTRHENIHRDEKPFHCYLCQKQFNRADHVKKHFLRMHRDQPYDINRIRRPAGRALPAPVPAPAPAPPPAPLYYKPEPQPEYRAPAPKPERTAPPGAGPGAGAGAAAAGGAGAGARRKPERRYACCYCSWSGADNWCLKRHLNTHLKPFACSLCEYKAARAERLHTHVHKVHNKKACGKCAHLAEDAAQLAVHLRDAHQVEARGLRVPAPGGSETAAAVASITGRRAAGRGAAGRQGAARLFGYLEASDGSADELDPQQYSPAPFARDKENAAPLHDHCLRY